MEKPNDSRPDSGRRRQQAEGYLCVLIGDECCTFILNNTAPDGTITMALQALTALSSELAKNSGINDPLTNWLEQWFGKWKRVATSILTSLLVVFGVMTLLGGVLYIVYGD
jgi:hypothetical protein